MKEKKMMLSAINDKNFELVKCIMENEPGVINEKVNDVPLVLSVAQTGNIELLKYVVEYTISDMTLCDGKYRTMLHYAVMSGNLEVCKYLVDRVGFSPLDGDRDLITPYELARKLGYKNIEDYFETIVGAPLSNMYKNPVLSGMSPDPSIVRVGKDYYMVNSSLTYFPCIPISHSKDLIHWEIIGHAITNPKWAMLEGIDFGKGYWAADISYHEGRFYIAGTFRFNDCEKVRRKQFVVSADKAEGPYSKPVIIDEDGIDPSLFTDDDGRRYMLLNRGARIFELNSDATEKIGESELLYYGYDKRYTEAPHLLKKDGYYYLFVAEGGTGPEHRITVSRSKTLKGKYEPCPYNPIMIQKDKNATIQRCGHGKPILTQNGQWFMVYLCSRNVYDRDGNGFSVLGRETAMDPIFWTEDQWPIVNNLSGPSCLQIKPNLQEEIFSQDICGFDEKNFYKTWVSVRPPEEDGFEICGNRLKLKGSKEELNSAYAKNILLQKQRDFNVTVVCKMEVPKLKAEQNAGVTCYYDENTYIKFGVFGSAMYNYVTVVEKIGNDIKNHPVVALSNNVEALYFRMEISGLKRRFLLSEDGETYKEIAYLDNVYYLSDEGLSYGARFSGAMYGIYAVAGKKADNDLKVTFDYFDVY